MNFALSKTKIIILFQAELFLLLILFGVSGSSITNIKSHVQGLLSMDEKVLIGHPQGIRSDEWAVNTLLSIGQFQNNNPRVNPNLGPTTKDMSVVHDTGVPTSELSTLAKANLWGFFAFDLRRALAWDWWIPVFTGLNGIWLLLNLLFPGQPCFNFSLALLLTFAPECVVWSNWPILHVGTACMAVSLAILALKSTNAIKSLTLAIFTGLLISWFILQLYLPRLIPIVMISVATYTGYCINNRVKFFSKFNCIFIIYTLLLAACLIFDWYSRNSDGIAGMLNSAYPGQRRVYGGFPLTDWDYNYVRGWLFPITSRHELYANFCEAQSYISLFIPISIFILYYAFKYYRRINYIVIFNFALLILFVVYEYIGLPEIIGKLTLLNRSKPYRSIIGISLTSVILLAFLYRSKVQSSIRHKFIIFALSLVPFIIFFCRRQELVNNLTADYRSKFICILFFIIAVNLILIYRIKYVTVALLLFVLPVTLFWNPIIIAPSYVQVTLPQQIRSAAHENLKYDGRILVMGDYPLLANIFFAGGHKVMNATSHYVDPYMYKNFYSKFDNPEQYNRFDHLAVVADDAEPDISISLGGLDWIKIRVNARNYDFSSFPADYIAIQKPSSKELNSNPKLEFIEELGNFSFYRIRHL
jgi:hypothetical protein